VDYIPEIETARFCTYGRGVWDFKVEEFTTVSEQSKNSDASAGIQINVIPNPVSDNSTISFDLPVSGFTTVKIFDIQGRIVGSLFNGIMEAGNHEFNWTGTTVNGTRLPQGDYMCVVAAYGRSWFAKIKLIK
jgi:flagellar hook assembly protein FlgD